MKLPWSNRKKALLIIDVQPGFLNERNAYVVPRISQLIQNTRYDFYVESIFHTEKGSIWDTQTNWILPKDQDFKTVDEVTALLSEKKSLHIEKETKSAFKGNVDLTAELRKRGVEEVHLVGVDTNDCVLATAFEAFDQGFFTYVIEECAESSSSEKMKDAGLIILRHLKLTNNTCIEKVSFKEIL